MVNEKLRANSETLVEFVGKQTFAGAIGLEPLSIDDKLRNGSLAHMADHFFGCAGGLFDVDLGVLQGMFVEVLLGGAAVPAPGCGVKQDVHRLIVSPQAWARNSQNRAQEQVGMEMSLNAEKIIRLLGLEPHPVEGGRYRRTYTSGLTLETEQGRRATASAIYYLLERGTFSEMHRLRSEEIFHFYAGEAVEMLQLWPDGSARRVVLGHDLEAGQAVQVVVPADVWQGTRMAGQGQWALLGCTVSPAFQFEDYESGVCDELTAKWPQQAAMIRALTRR